MLIGATADLHGWLPDFPAEQLDLLLVAGDIGVTPDWKLEAFPGYANTLADFDDWLDAAGCPVVGIAGNHDFGFQNRGGKLRDPGDTFARNLNWTYLCDQTAVIDGLVIHGSPWTPTFGQWAFMEDEPQLAERWKRIPHGVDILLTHGPPRGIMDVGFGGEHAGSKTLDRWLNDLYPKRPQLHVFGHFHSGRGTLTRADGSITANVSLVGEDYQPQGGIVVFDI